MREDCIQYKVTMTYAERDTYVSAPVPKMRSIFSYAKEKYGDLLAETAIMASEWRQTRAPGRKIVSVNVTEEINDELCRICATGFSSMSEVIRAIIRLYGGIDDRRRSNGNHQKDCK